MAAVLITVDASTTTTLALDVIAAGTTPAHLRVRLSVVAGKCVGYAMSHLGLVRTACELTWATRVIDGATTLH